MRRENWFSSLLYNFWLPWIRLLALVSQPNAFLLKRAGPKADLPEDIPTGQQTQTPVLMPSMSGWNAAKLEPLRDRDLSASLWGCCRGFFWVPASLWKRQPKPEKSATLSHWKYNLEALSWNVATYSCHTTLGNWNHILCQTSKDIITWKLFLLPWCMVKSSLPQM